jgi:hypothetical protein
MVEPTDAGHVRCPVCDAHATITVEARSADDPFREGSWLTVTASARGL